MPFRSNLELSLRLLLATVLGGSFVLLLGPWILHALQPVFEVVFSLLQPDVLANISLTQGPVSSAIITASTYSLHGIAINGHIVVAANSPLIAVTTEAPHALLPASILLAGLLFWPAHRGEYLARVVWGLTFLLALLCLMTPLLLAGRVEIYLLDQMSQAGVTPHPFHSPLLIWMVFSEMGGRWLLPILLVVACNALSRRPALAR